MQREDLRKRVQMHENDNYFREGKVLSGTYDPILRDYLRISGSPMVTSNRSGAHGLRNSKEVRQVLKQGRRGLKRYTHRILYGSTVTIIAALVAIIWG